MFSDRNGTPDWEEEKFVKGKLGRGGARYLY